LHRVLRLTSDDPPDEKLRKLKAALAPYPMAWPDVIPLVASLLSLPLAHRYPPLNFSPRRQRQKTLDAVVPMLLAQVEQQLLLCTMEDLHWIGPSTLELLSLLIDQRPTPHVLTLLTCRPEFRPRGLPGRTSPSSRSAVYRPLILIRRAHGLKVGAEKCKELPAVRDILAASGWSAKKQP
jgi:predicted ATPase